MAYHGLGVGIDIYPEAHQIARCARAEQWEEYIKAFAHAPHREGLAHILGMAMHVVAAANINNAPNPNGGIHDEAAKRFACARQIALQQVAGQDGWRAEVTEYIANP